MVIYWNLGSREQHSLFLFNLTRYSDLEALMAITHVLTINVEDYFQAPLYQHAIPEKDWALFTPRIEITISKMLLLLSEHKTQATFFVYAWTIDRFPHVIQQIAQEGHELAFRYNLPAHKKVNKIQFVSHIKLYQQRLRKLSGKKVAGFRSRGSLYNLDNEWVYDELMLANYDYSSCDAINILPEQWQLLDEVSMPRLGFKEIPVTSEGWFGREWALVNSNALKMRNFERTCQLMRNYTDDYKKPVVANISSWVLDSEQPHIRGDSKLKQWLHYYHIKNAPVLVHQLLTEFSWGKMSDIHLNKVVALNTSNRKRGHYQRS